MHGWGHTENKGVIYLKLRLREGKADGFVWISYARGKISEVAGGFVLGFVSPRGLSPDIASRVR